MDEHQCESECGNVQEKEPVPEEVFSGPLPDTETPRAEIPKGCRSKPNKIRIRVEKRIKHFTFEPKMPSWICAQEPLIYMEYSLHFPHLVVHSILLLLDLRDLVLPLGSWGCPGRTCLRAVSALWTQVRIQKNHMINHDGNTMHIVLAPPLRHSLSLSLLFNSLCPALLFCARSPSRDSDPTLPLRVLRT